MQIIFKLLLGMFLIQFCVGCEEKDPIKSKVTFFSEVDQYRLKKVGDSFSFSEIKAFENGEEIEIDLDESVNVDTNTVGVYGIPFSTMNSDGFEKRGQVFVSVVEDPEVVLSQDISGVYYDDFVPDDGDNIVESLGNGFFSFSDVFIPNKISVVVAIINDSELILPEQNTDFGVTIIADEIRDPDTYGFFDDESIDIGIRFEGDESPIALFFVKR